MKTLLSLLLTAVLFLSSAFAESAVGALQEMYAQGELLMVQGDYTGAAARFEALGTYADASQMAMYCKAIAAAESLGLYSMAVDAFNDLGDFKDSRQMAKYYEGRAHEAAGTIDAASASDADLSQVLWQLEEAEKVYGGLAFFKDSLTRYGACGERIKEIQGEQSRRAAEKREGTYQRALTLEQSGDYAGAIELYRSINGYKDSDTQAAVLWDKLTLPIRENLETAKVGDYINFGAYEQDNNTANGSEAIEWLVLEQENNRMLVVSRYVLDCKPYNDQETAVTWETCTLRTWLNKEFFNAAFNSAEQEMIPTATVAVDEYHTQKSNPGNATQDKVFLLRLIDTVMYFQTNGARQCEPTDYAKAQGVFNESGGGQWWSCSSGESQDKASFVRFNGSYGSSGLKVNRTDIGVRPAMWINLAP